MVSRKTKIWEFEIAAATEACLSMIHNKVPAKRTDTGSFTIPCSIGNNYSCKALCDPGASINLMPKFIFRKDILVRVDKFIFPADFMIRDCEVDEYTHIILGRPFLATVEY
ncbi:hypothetical protein GQ457_04G024780 [Hibiscus cannabinus]